MELNLEMDDKKLYSELLNLDPSWEVTSVKLNHEEEEIVVFVAYKSSRALCPRCGMECSIYDHSRARRWRHLDTCQMKTYIELCRPRISCQKHGVLSIKVPWSTEHSRFTLLFERLAITMLQSFKKQTKVAELLRISFDQIHYLMERAVERGLERRDKTEYIEYLGIDEKSIGSHHKYASVLVNHGTSSVIELVEGRDEESAKSLLENSLSKEQRKNVKAITMDFGDSYANATISILPNADIVHDRFHLSKNLNKVVDEVRRTEIKSLCKEEKGILKNTRYIFLQNPVKWSSAYRTRFEKIQSMNLKTSDAWRIKENFRGFFGSTSIAEATLYFNQWMLDAQAVKLSPVNKVIKTFLAHIRGILNYVKYKISNAISESINSLIQEIKYVARGFRNFKNYRNSVLFYLGNLELYP